jgi:hypothetical protein
VLKKEFPGLESKDGLRFWLTSMDYCLFIAIFLKKKHAADILWQHVFSFFYSLFGLGMIKTGHFDFLATLSETLPEMK